MPQMSSGFLTQFSDKIRLPIEIEKIEPIILQPHPTIEKPVIPYNVEHETFKLINAYRLEAGSPQTQWDQELYELSRKHTEAMARARDLFHSPDNASYGETCWGGVGYKHYSNAELSQIIVESWVASPLHRAWLLHKPIKSSAVSIITNHNGQYASWTFWMSEVDGGPALISKVVREWESETGGNIPWIEWLRDKHYID